MNNDKVKIQTVAVPEKAPKVDTGLVVRTIIYLIAIINAGAALFGYDINIKADEDRLYELITLIFAAGTFISAYWKNNNVTKPARIKAEVAEQVDVKK